MFRAIRLAVQLVWPYLLTPWRSPLLRWRMETYGIRDARGRLLTASAVTPAVFCRFVVTHWRVVLRFMRWAATL